MADDHYLPLFWGDFLASTQTWTGAQRGLYVQMLALLWSVETLTLDEPNIARSLAYSVREFRRLWRTVRVKFDVSPDGHITNRRLEQIRKRNKEIAEKRREAGRRGAHGKWHGKQDDNSQPAPMAIATILPSVLPYHPIRSVSEDLSRPDTPSQSHTRNARARSSPIDAQAVLDRLKVRYPEFAGRQNWLIVGHTIGRLLDEGVTDTELEAGTERYAKYCKGGGVSDTGKVLSPVKFYGDPDKPWSQAWELPKRKSNGHLEDDATRAYDALLASDGAKRDDRVQAAIEAIGGWSRIRMRTPYDEKAIRSEFCEAYRNGA